VSEFEVGGRHKALKYSPFLKSKDNMYKKTKEEKRTNLKNRQPGQSEGNAIGGLLLRGACARHQGDEKGGESQDKLVELRDSTNQSTR